VFTPPQFEKPANEGWTTSDNQNYYQDVPYHQCTLQDNQGFYSANKNFAINANLIFSTMFCIDNLDFINFYGNFNTDNTQSLRIELLSCFSDATNKNCKDPNDLIKKNAWPYLITLVNSQRYEKENYDSNIIIEESLL
jgi:hypothetical protein